MLSSIFETINSREPISRLIRNTASKNKNLIVLNILSSIFYSITEGATLGVIYLAISILLGNNNYSYDSGITSLPIISNIISYLNNLNTNTYFVLLIIFAILLQFVQFLAKYINKVSTAYFSSKCRVLVTSLIHTKVLSLSFNKASKYRIGDLSDYALQSPVNIRKFIEILFDIIVNIILIVTYIFIMINISFDLLIAVFIIVSIVIFVQRKLIPSIRKSSVIVTDEEVNIISSITEDFQGLRFLHSHGLLNIAIENLNIKLKNLEKSLNLQAIKMSFIDPFSTFLPVPAVALVAILNLLLNRGNNENFLAGLVTFILCLQRLNVKITNITSNQNTFSENFQRLIRINRLLSIRSDSKEDKKLSNIKKFKDKISFRGVSLSYANKKDYSLNNINLEIKKGSTVALIGKSGAGKSSISDLLIGLYKTSSGGIYIDEMNLENINKESWQSLLGVVSQDTYLFNTTIYNNISFGINKCTLKRVQEAASLAGASDFIEDLPDGYKTIVGERGYTLSGGQKQRIALARAFVRKPQIIVLDEATSALDSKSEIKIKQSINKNKGDKTFFIIAHRLSTIVNADSILVLDKGEIKEKGTHKELILRNGIYKDLWDMQSINKI